MLKILCNVFKFMVVYYLIGYRGLVVERELWSGGFRVSFFCILLNDGVYICNKYIVLI